MDLLPRYPREYHGQPFLTVAAVIAFALLGGGCYESAVPLGPVEQASTDSTFFGMWVLAEQKDEQVPTRMRVAAYDEHSYQVEFCCAELLRSRAEADLLRAHTVLVDDEWFVNVQDLESDETPYLFFRYVRSDDDILTLWPVAECLFADTALTTSEALFAFIRDHLSHERLYLEEPLRFEKVEE